MRKLFFGSEFKIGLLVLGLFYVLALFGFFVGYTPFILFAILITTFMLSMANIEFGIGIAFLELFSSPHGQLLSVDIFGFHFSLRMAIFIAVMLSWGIQLFQKRIQLSMDYRIQMFGVLVMAVLIGGLVGVFRNPLTDVFADGNAYLYLMYLLPILSIRWTTKKQRMLLQLLAAGAVFSVLITFISLFIFSHFDEAVLSTSYAFLRDLRIAEITNLGDGFYRVFQQTHFFIIVFLLLVAAMVLQKRTFAALSVVICGVGLSVILLSLSRSFWLGSAVAIFALIFIMALRFRPHAKGLLHLFGGLLVSCILGVVLVCTIVLFPFPAQHLTGADLADAFGKRATESDDVAVSSRWKLLDPMLETIFAHPVEGSGFGASVTFVSDDPRVRELNETGAWTTYAMEWGWLEVWMKMGILAPAGFLLLFFVLLKQFLFSKDLPRTWLHFGLSASLLFLVMTHFFSPYLNHPIGLGFILFCIPFLPAKTKTEAAVLASGYVELTTSEVPVMAARTTK